MRRVVAWSAAVMVLACPERKAPERGVALEFECPRPASELRATVERRLAQLQVRAKLADEKTRLTVRLPGEQRPEDVALVIRLVTTPATLDFCVEAPPSADQLCARPGAKHEADRSDCFVEGARGELAAVANAMDGGVLVGRSAPNEPLRTFFAEPGCARPRVLEASADRDHPTLSITLDAPGASAIEALTRRALKRRCLIVLDGEVQSSPVVQEPITGGRLMISFGADRNSSQLGEFAGLLVGGPLPSGISLVREGRYGPPSL